MNKDDIIMTLKQMKYEISKLENSINNDDLLNEYFIKENIYSEQDNNSASDVLNNFSTISREYESCNSRTTTLHLIESTFERLDNLNSFIEVSTSNNSFYNHNLNSDEEINNFKQITKSFKTKFITLAIENYINRWEAEVKEVPSVKKVRYKNDKKNEYNRSYIWSEDGITYGVTLDKRSNEIEFLTSSKERVNVYNTKKGIIRFSTKEKIEAWFEEKKQLAESQKKSK